MHQKTKKITKLILTAAEKARREIAPDESPDLAKPVKWPVECLVGPGLEGAIACESNVGYVNGSRGYLIYRGYDIFDLCAYSTYEEVCYLLLHGSLPTAVQLKAFKNKLVACRNVPDTLRLMLNFSLEKMNPMAALRLGVNLMRQEFTYVDRDDRQVAEAIDTDADSIPMETRPRGEKRAVYEFRKMQEAKNNKKIFRELEPAVGQRPCYHLIAGVASIAASIARIHKGHFPIEPDQHLSHAANLIYMMTGKVPTPEEERIMDISLILHADHGMNASTFASMVVASTLSDMYLSVGSGIAALNGPLHGGANERVLRMLEEIGDAENVKSWYERCRKKKQKVMGFGHRVYKAYDPRARILRPLAEYLSKNNKQTSKLFDVSQKLEKEVISTLGAEKGIFPNVDFYSGIVYRSLGIPTDFFTPMFAASRVAGWTARVQEYLKHNRIFRPRAMYTGKFDQKYVPLEDRDEQPK